MVLIRLLLVKILMLDYNTNFDTVVDVNAIVTCSYDEMSDLMYIVQLSCVETQFQKCSQYGKNGSKHPMISISIAYDMISCKKNQKKH